MLPINPLVEHKASIQFSLFIIILSYFQFFISALNAGLAITVPQQIKYENSCSKPWLECRAGHRKVDTQPPWLSHRNRLKGLDTGWLRCPITWKEIIFGMGNLKAAVIQVNKYKIRKDNRPGMLGLWIINCKTSIKILHCSFNLSYYSVSASLRRKTNIFQKWLHNR